jgi:hypothetical protein
MRRVEVLRSEAGRAVGARRDDRQRVDLGSVFECPAGSSRVSLATRVRFVDVPDSVAAV